MHVLWVHSVCPYPPTDGNRARHYGLLSALSRKHDITLVCPVSPEEHDRLPEWEEVCERVVPVPMEGTRRRARPAFAARLLDMISGTPACIVPAAMDRLSREVRALSAARSYDAAFGGLYVAPAVIAANADRQVLDDQNVERDLYRSLWQQERSPVRKLARLADWEEVRRFEKRWLRRADAVTVCSADDSRRLGDAIPRLPPVTVVPNGVEAKTPAERRPSDTPVVIFVGSFGYVPNADAARSLLQDVGPRIRRRRPDTKIMIVGKDPPADLRARATTMDTVTGEIPSILPYLAAATVAVIPLWSGGGTKLKILEAMAAGVPVVATPTAVRGLDLRHGEEVLVGDSPDALAEAALNLMGDPALARRLAEAAALRVDEQYRWPTISRKLTTALTGKASP